MAFHEVLYPARLSYGSTGGPERRTEIVTLANGFEERNSPWAHSRRRYDAGGGLRSLDDVAVLVAFFEARMGRLHGFRWKDWADYKSCPPSAAISATDQQIGVGDGVERSFRLTKRYASAGSAYLRPIAKPVAGSLRIALEGGEVTAWEADPEGGVVTFAAPPARGVSITAGYEFDVPVRFDTDQIRTSVATFQAGEVPDVPVVELRL